MPKLVFGMNQSLDGYADHMAFAPVDCLEAMAQSSRVDAAPIVKPGAAKPWRIS
jgi:hypothetical protein